MDATALLLSRLQFAFTISFHIIFPSFTIGLAAWLTILEALYLATGRPAYRVVFEFWLKIFGVAFGLGVVSGIVMAFQFGTNWDVLARMVGTNSRGAAFLRNLHSLFSRGQFFWHSSLRTPSRSAVVLPVFDRDGGAGHHAFGVLDHGQQQLDAGARRLRDRERRIRPDRLVQDRLQSGSMGAFPPYAARFLHHRRLLRRCDAAPGTCCVGNSTPKRASCCAWVSCLEPCSSRSNSSSDT